MNVQDSIGNVTRVTEAASAATGPSTIETLDRIDQFGQFLNSFLLAVHSNCKWTETVEVNNENIADQ